jgi:2-polyprenyl-3-methyl-5-hydroxy-6-metoxy-1,4-benzoquinol methylase
VSLSTETDIVKLRERRWNEEAAFFDRAAGQIETASLVLDPLALQRYSRPGLRKRFNKEYRFKVLGPLQGKTLLDLRCGSGQNSVMLARMGARVTGIDVSPGAIDVARRRALVNGVADRVRFLCAPIEKAPLADREFDIVWGTASCITFSTIGIWS